MRSSGEVARLCGVESHVVELFALHDRPAAQRVDASGFRGHAAIALFGEFRVLVDAHLPAGEPEATQGGGSFDRPGDPRLDLELGAPSRVRRLSLRALGSPAAGTVAMYLQSPMRRACWYCSPWIPSE